jgi:TRAP-type C4-dicarboxylate transport system substrate-binding protein
VVANAYNRSESVPEIARFSAYVDRLGGGRLRIVVVNGWASRADRDEERTVLEDLARGVADLAWTGARAVGAVFGVGSIDPLLAPLLFPDEEAVRRFLVAAPLAPLLAPLREVGVRGLALMPGELRRPFGITGALVRPEDWRGKVIRTHASLTAEATIRALGATPVLRSARELGGGPPREIDGMDLAPRTVVVRAHPGWLTWNVPLWPRLLLLAVNQESFKRLSVADQAVLEEAARRTTAHSAKLPRLTQLEMPVSVRVVEASEHDLSLLREELRPVHDELRSTRNGEKTLAYVERFLDAHSRARPSA